MSARVVPPPPPTRPPSPWAHPQDAEKLKSALHLTVTKASKSAIAAVEAAGGSVVTQYDSQLSLRATLKPEKFSIIPKRPAPPPKAMPYYLEDENRGYLSQQVQLAAAKQRLPKE